MRLTNRPMKYLLSLIDSGIMHHWLFVALAYGITTFVLIVLVMHAHRAYKTAQRAHQRLFATPTHKNHPQTRGG